MDDDSKYNNKNNNWYQSLDCFNANVYLNQLKIEDDYGHGKIFYFIKISRSDRY